MASVIPGILKSIELLQEMLFDLQARIAASETQNAPKENARAFLARWARGAETRTPAKVSVQVSAQQAYWAKMTSAERSAEMRRRGMVSKKRVKKPSINANHPGKPSHPDHQAWLDKIARVKAANRRAKAKAVAA